MVKSTRHSVMQLKSEVEESVSKRVFDILRSSFPLFENWSQKDMKSLVSYAKILSFQKNTLLTKIGEKVDFLGFFLSGTALIRKNDRTFGFMGMGDLLGYMAWMDLPGCELHSFNIRGENEGYMAVITMDSLEIISKRDPELFFKLSILCSRYSLTTVKTQVEGAKLKTGFKLKVTEFRKRSKKIEKLTEDPGSFGQYFIKLDRRTRKTVTRNCDVISFVAEQDVINSGTPVKSIFIVSKGRLQVFDKYGPGKICETGHILGVKEFLFGMTWEYNLVGCQTGVLIGIKKDNLLDLLEANNKAGLSLLTFFVSHSCESIRARYKHKKKSNKDSFELMMGGSYSGKEESQETENKEEEKNMPFIEFDVCKREFNFLESDKGKKDSYQMKPFTSKLREPPLFKHKVFGILNTPEEVRMEDVVMANNDEKGLGIFIKEKITTQRRELREKKKELKKLRKRGLVMVEDMVTKKTKKNHRMDPKDLANFEALEIEYETMKNEYNLLQMSMDEITEKYTEKERELKTLQDDFKVLKMKNISSKAQRNLFLVHKELKSKILHLSGKDAYSKMLKKRNDRCMNFREVLNQQLTTNRKKGLVLRCIAKWRQFVKNRKVQVKLLLEESSD